MATLVYKCTYLEGVDTDEQPSKNCCVFIDCKQPNDPGETKERKDDDEGFEQVPACAQWIKIVQNDTTIYNYAHKEYIPLYVYTYSKTTVNYSMRSDGILVFESYANCLNILLASMLSHCSWIITSSDVHVK